MPSIRHLQFGGIRPAVSRKLLPPPFAQIAHNAELRNGELCPFMAPCDIGVCDAPVLHQADDTGEVTCHDGCAVDYFDMCNGDVHTAVFPVDSDPYIVGEDENHTLVLNPPPMPPVLDQMDAGTVTVRNGPDARSYVYTWVDAFGHESPPSPPTDVVTAAYDSSWRLVFAPPPDWAVCLRVYRTTSSISNDYEQPDQFTGYQLVREIDAGTVFVDDILQRDMDLQSLQTIDNCPPPPMDCVVELESGHFAGWRGREVYFSERGEPYNWPDRYRYTLAHNIVGADVNGDSLYVGTEGTPYRIDVALPRGDIEFSQVQVTRYKAKAPLRHARGIVCTEEGVAMSSTSGVWSLTPRGASLMTRGRVDEDVWLRDFDPEIMVWHRERLFGYGANGGFILGWQGGEGSLDIGDLVTIDWAPDDVLAGHDNELYYSQDGRLWKWDCGPEPMEYVWRSAVTRTPGEIHWAAAKVVGDFDDGRWAEITVSNLECGEYDTTRVDESGIYRVPCHPRGVHWEVEIRGTACLCEYHLATSKPELTEQGAAQSK